MTDKINEPSVVIYVEWINVTVILHCHNVSLLRQKSDRYSLVCSRQSTKKDSRSRTNVYFLDV